MYHDQHSLREQFTLVNKNSFYLWYRTLAKLKEIQNHRKQRRTSFIGSVKEALPLWAKKKGPGKYLQLQPLISDTEDYEVREAQGLERDVPLSGQKYQTLDLVFVMRVATSI